MDSAVPSGEVCAGYGFSCTFGGINMEQHGIMNQCAWEYHQDIYGVSINGVPNSWTVYKGKSHEKMDDLEVPLFEETSIYI